MNSNFKDEYIKATHHIANKISLLRRTLNLSQEKFAEKVNIDRRTIIRAEKGEYRPSHETLQTIAFSLNIPLSYFFDNSTYEINSDNLEIIKEITTKLNTSTNEKLHKINKIIDFI